MMVFVIFLVMVIFMTFFVRMNFVVMVAIMRTIITVMQKKIRRALLMSMGMLKNLGETERMQPHCYGKEAYYERS